MPTELPTPCPRGPVVVSTPVVTPCSGCPGVKLSNWRKRWMSSSETAGFPVFSPRGPSSTTPARCSIEYWSIDAWPQDKTNRSRSGHAGSSGS
jgi:hypothetical protein